MTICTLKEFYTPEAEPDGEFLRLKGQPIDARIVEAFGYELNSSYNLEDNKIYKLNRSREALDNPEVIRSINEAPLFYKHYDANVKNASKHTAGYPVGPASWTTPTTIRQDYKLTSAEAISAYRTGKAKELSPQYNFILEEAPQDAPYDFEMASITIDHIAQVEQGQNGPSISLREKKKTRHTGMTEEEKVEIKKMIDDNNTVIVATLKEEIKSAFKESKPEPKEDEIKDEDHYKAKLAEQARFNDDVNLATKFLGEDYEEKINTIKENSKPDEVGSRAILGMALDLGPDKIKAESLTVMRTRLQERINTKKEAKNNERSEASVVKTGKNGGASTLSEARKTYNENIKKAQAEMLGRNVKAA